MQKAIKYIIPLLGILYCIAFFEAEIGQNQHQTYHDEYDTYTYSQSKDLSTNQLIKQNFKLSNGSVTCLLNGQLSSFLIKPTVSITESKKSDFPNKLFIKNCLWLI